MKIDVDTALYKNEYGREPRGDGAWGFEIGTAIYVYCGTYAQAKALALRDARRIGETRVRVCR